MDRLTRIQYKGSKVAVAILDLGYIFKEETISISNSSPTMVFCVDVNVGVGVVVLLGIGLEKGVG